MQLFYNFICSLDCNDLQVINNSNMMLTIFPLRV